MAKLVHVLMNLLALYGLADRPSPSRRRRSAVYISRPELSR